MVYGSAMKLYTLLTALLLIIPKLSANPTINDVKFKDGQIIYRVSYDVPDSITNSYVALEQSADLVDGTWKVISEWQTVADNTVCTNSIPALPQQFFRLTEIQYSSGVGNLIPADARYHQDATPGGGYEIYVYIFDSLEIGATYTIAFGKNEIEVDNDDQWFYSTTTFVASFTQLSFHSDSVQPVTAILLKN